MRIALRASATDYPEDTAGRLMQVISRAPTDRRLRHRHDARYAAPDDLPEIH
jgi:hypothetical protein